MPLSWRQLASLLGPPGPMTPLVLSMPSPQVNDRRILLRAPQALTISRVDAVLSGGTSPSCSFSLRHGADVSAAGTAATTDPITVTSTTTGSAITSFQAPEIPAEHWLWLDVAAISGSPQALTVAVQFS
ncbi:MULTISPECIES: hypothetical protein [unclassified Cyanobium]|uniref:hypothetical protein n=1 Tax=unclassified Cyanobium TaxID=2627006 RepID=UPI0020CE0EC6|nr:MULTISPECIES: hypothetical protein [unclassified Cyanobium]MCP9860288.1 hypothetical protein [Cyanobium sp. Cruz-8H5]MCP9867058.1 hypothetical protein [Cyanobium sp. Cruz-8D1]